MYNSLWASYLRVYVRRAKRETGLLRASQQVLGVPLYVTRPVKVPRCQIVSCLGADCWSLGTTVPPNISHVTKPKGLDSENHESVFAKTGLPVLSYSEVSAWYTHPAVAHANHCMHCTPFLLTAAAHSRVTRSECVFLGSGIVGPVVCTGGGCRAAQRAERAEIHPTVTISTCSFF